MLKKIYLLCICVLILFSVSCVYAIEEDVVLKIMPNTTSINLSSEEQKVIYTITLVPKSGIEIGSFSFKFDVPENMSLKDNNISEMNGAGYWINGELMYHNTISPNGIFESITYTPTSKTFIAYGTTNDRHLSKEVVVMTVEATIAGDTDGIFTLDVDTTSPFVAGDVTGDKSYTNLKVETTPVEIVKENETDNNDNKVNGGGSTSVQEYQITVTQNANGTISPSSKKVVKGKNQKFEIRANDGYEIEDVLVDGKSVGAVSSYTFENIKEKHTIEAKFKKLEEVIVENWKNPFKDVKENDWFYNSVKFANENNLFKGVSNTEFGPSVNMTRGMIVTVLYRYANVNTTKEATFDDVAKGSYYSNAIAWAAENGIVNGVGNNKFNPNASVTRQDFVVILYRFAVKTGIDVSVGENANTLSYSDASQISEYAVSALQWACKEGIITGRTTSTLAPKGTATRAEVATMIMRFVK